MLSDRVLGSSTLLVVLSATKTLLLLRSSQADFVATPEMYGMSSLLLVTTSGAP